MIKLSDYVKSEKIHYDLLESICNDVAKALYSVKYSYAWIKMYRKAAKMGMQKGGSCVSFLADKLKHRLFIEFLREQNNLAFEANKPFVKRTLELHGLDIATIKEKAYVNTSRAINIKKYAGGSNERA